MRRFETTKLDAKTVRRDANGYVKLPARTTRVGVFTYRRADGSVVRELRPPEEVFHADSMASLKGIPVTNDHPDQLLTAKTARKHTVGFTGDSVTIGEDKYLDTFVTIIDDDTIKDIQSGKEEISLGYSVDHDHTPGVFDGIPYDVIQRNIVYNHLSVVDRGRAGPSVKLRLDVMDAELVTDEEQTIPKEEPLMAKLKIGEKEFDASQELVDAFNAKQGEMDAAKKAAVDAAVVTAKADADKELGAVVAEKSELKAKLDTAEGRLVALETEAKAKLDAADPKRIDALVQERMDIQSVGLAVKADMKFDGLSNDEIKRSIVGEKFPEVKLDGRSAEFVDGLFESISKSASTKAGSIERLGAKLASRLDRGGDVTSADEARKRSMTESKDLWKQPLNGKGA